MLLKPLSVLEIMLGHLTVMCASWSEYLMIVARQQMHMTTAKPLHADVACTPMFLFVFFICASPMPV